MCVFVLVFRCSFPYALRVESDSRNAFLRKHTLGNDSMLDLSPSCPPLISLPISTVFDFLTPNTFSHRRFLITFSLLRCLLIRFAFLRSLGFVLTGFKWREILIETGSSIFASFSVFRIEFHEFHEIFLWLIENWKLRKSKSVTRNFFSPFWAVNFVVKR